ncbi:anti-phage dCTP deaminase [Sphingomonas sp.]|jgi:deoxycytidylate deaminase|uniref:anti-phage dCTP deaminase n=1 Tax=Sphingomonas sp. TaxID=28214 RepID=UPI003566E2BA
MQAPKLINEAHVSIKGGVALEINERLSQELVIALVGPVGSGVSSAAEFLREALDGEFGYDVAPIMKPSDVIRSQSGLVGIRAPASSRTATYISEMQDAGNKLRQCFGNNYLIEKVVEKIRSYRTTKLGYNGENEVPGRRAYIIDSLKSMEELQLLRDIYRDTLCVIGIFAPDKLRDERLKNLDYPEAERQKVMARDQGELATFGQATRKLFIHSDFFVCNDRRLDDLKANLNRFLDIVFDTAIHTPTRAESAMYEANAAAANSACMSRQVGVSIISAGGELIAVGWNDVPKFGGSLYTEDDRAVIDAESKAIIDGDHRCYNWGGKKCHNEIRRHSLMDKVAIAVADSGQIRQGGRAAVREAIGKTDINSLIEFSRSIHAEMEAILSVAREGKHSLVGATLYTNTYPCHNCARHIVASGIKEVVYIEPYLKSLAIELHSDVISELPDARNMVVFRQFNGVAPANFLKLFRPKGDRKNQGRLIRTPRKEALPIFRVPLDARRDYEDKVIADITAKEQDQVNKPGANP